MRQKHIWIALLVLSTITIAVCLACTRPILAQARTPHGDTGRSTSAYDPYPPGILLQLEL